MCRCLRSGSSILKQSNAKRRCVTHEHKKASDPHRDRTLFTREETVLAAQTSPWASMALRLGIAKQRPRLMSHGSTVPQTPRIIGKFDLPEQEAAQAAAPEKKRKKKLRREMSEEQREILRKRDKERYARRTAAKKTAEEAARAEICSCSSFATAPASESSHCG